MDQLLEEFRARVRAAAASGTSLCLQGGGSKQFYGQSVEGAVFDTRPYHGIIDYEPSELVVTARCGTPLSMLEQVLDGEQQMLAFEPPHFGAATIGGMVASGLSGPRRRSAGAVRDYVLGATLLNGKGELLRFGGRVMKNVAGYDVSRLLAGSLGTLGAIVEVSLKVMPKPCAEATRRFAVDQAGAISSLNAWATQGHPISADCWHDNVLTIRLSGSSAAVHKASSELGGEPVELIEASEFWRALREHQHPYLLATGSSGLWRVSVPATSATLSLPGGQLTEWGGALRWFADVEDPAGLRAAAAALGGHATLFSGGDKRIGVFQPMPLPLARIHQRLKLAFDPSSVFNPNRMYRYN